MPDRREMATYEGRNVLVTGGLGFIGSHLAVRLVRLGARVTIIDSLVPEFGGDRDNIPAGLRDVTVNISDLRDADSLRVLVRDKDYIFHLAGQVSHGNSMRAPELDLGVNCVATINLLEACRRHNPRARLLYTSTRQVYGIPRFLPVTEDHPTLPVDVNGINKLAAEYYHLLYHRTYELKSVVLRLTNTYGPRQQIHNDRQGFVGVFIRQALRGETIRVFGTGEQVRDFNYVCDVVDAVLLAAATESCYGRVFNLGSPEHGSLLNFLGALNEVCPLSYETIPFPDDRRLIDIGDYYGDYSLLRSLTGWTPRVGLREGLERAVTFFRGKKEKYLA